MLMGYGLENIATNVDCQVIRQAVGVTSNSSAWNLSTGNANGSAEFPAVFDSAMPFCGGVAAVETFQTMGKTADICRATLFQGKHGMIDHSGNYVWRDAEEQTWRSPFCH